MNAAVIGDALIGAGGIAIAYAAFIAPWLRAYRERTTAIERIGVAMMEHLGRRGF